MEVLSPHFNPFLFKLFSKKALIFPHNLIILSLLKKAKNLSDEILRYAQYDKFQHFFIKEP